MQQPMHMSSSQHNQMSARLVLTSPISLRLGVIGLIIAAALWAFSLNDIHMDQMNDLGLVSVLPIPFLIALGVLTLSFLLTLYTKPLTAPILGLQVVLLILMLSGTTAILGDEPRFAVTWRHVGVAEYIQRDGVIDPTIDAYFNWPGFFVLFAFFSEIAGLPNTISLGAWAPVAFDLIYLGPLFMIFRSLSDNKRLPWLAVWIFFITNWIGQDYYAPQALAYFMYLVITAILLRWFRVPAAPWALLEVFAPLLRPFSRLTNWLQDWLSWPEKPGATSQPYQRFGLFLIIVMIYIMVISSHQLTPFVILLAVTGLVVFNRISLRGLPTLLFVLTVLWIIYPATNYMNGHFANLITSLGNFGSSVDSNVGERLAGSPEHQLVVRTRLFLTLSIWLLAGLGIVRRWWNKRGDAVIVMLAFAPFALLGMQSYGGEVLLRIYLFNLPFMVFLVAGFFFPKPDTHLSWKTLAILSVLCITVLSGFLVSRYGNERMDYKTEDEIDAARVMYQVASPGSLMLALNPNVAWKFQNYETHKHQHALEVLQEHDFEGIIDMVMDPYFENGYLIVTRSQRAYTELFLGFTDEEWTKLTHTLDTSPRLHLIYTNPDARIYARTTNTDPIDEIMSPPESGSEPSKLVILLIMLLLFLGPGLALVMWLDLNDIWVELTIAMALGIAVVSNVANAAIYAGWWSPIGILLIIDALSAVAIFLKLRQPRPQSPSEPQSSSAA